jgi:serine/threonine protein kinase
MIDRLGVVRIVDFGRAVMAGESVSFLFGSPLYMAPETHRRQPGRPQTDFYSVGLVAIEMLSGKPLTDLDEVEEEELLRIKEELPHRLPDMLPREVRKRRSLVRILRRLIEPDPANRYGSAKEADVGDEGLIVVDKQFTKESGVTDRGRVLSEYLSKLVDDRTGRIELGNVLNAGPSSKVII